ncbi:uncharacterized protein EV420DRAFT_1472294 [Desarmillaria tabescens]|uniref:DUF6534 domain-containing protein n=1 Tax=Armillaria tabescens TaxID=1929756 RepID=A0AA39NP50_ARMTA|nr:uncharacterized protein EV420DRAFT_1472294 [Desarmillaria tabescens]KAK0468983.1 hypothetical protein EV420DRAFT_1472294 [Desarmillaria tabescens]
MYSVRNEVLATDPPVPPAFQDKLLGRVASRWIVIYFFKHYRRDRPLIKAGIIISLVMDTYRRNDRCGVILSDISFLELTRRILLGLYDIDFAAQAAGLIATAATQIMCPQYAERYKGRVYVTYVSVSLTFQSRKMNPTFQESKRYPVKVINRLIGSVISTGTASTTAAIVILIVFLKMPMINGPVSTGVAFCLGRLYSFTMLYSLNKRSALRAEGSSGHSSGHQDRAVNINAELFSSDGGIPFLKDVHHTARIDVSEAGRERESSSHSAASGVPAPKASYANIEAYLLHNLDTAVNKTGPENYQSGWAV